MASSPPPIDLEEFRSSMRAAGIEEIVQPMLTLFVQEAPKAVASIASALASRDLEAAGRAAHAFKSSAGNVRAKQLADLLQQLETAAGEGDSAGVARLFEAVGTAERAALAYLAQSGIG